MNVQLKIDSAVIKEFKAIISTTIEKAVKDVLQKENVQGEAPCTDDKPLTRAEVMELLQISHATLYHYQMDGTLPYLKIGNRVYFEKKNIFDNPKLKGDSFGIRDWVED